MLICNQVLNMLPDSLAEAMNPPLAQLLQLQRVSRVELVLYKLVT